MSLETVMVLDRDYEVERKALEQRRPHVLEAQMFDREDKFCRFKHVDYLNMIFENPLTAVAYYDRNHPHMRSLNAHNTWTSDWDPATKLRYRVREYDFEVCTIKGWAPKDRVKLASRGCKGKQCFEPGNSVWVKKVGSECDCELIIHTCGWCNYTSRPVPEWLYAHLCRDRCVMCGE